jgi:hypothetical protein
MRNGRGWAYATMLIMLALSVAGNIAHTYHLDATPSVRTVVYGIAWPLMVWAGVELFVRVPWQDKISHKLVRWVGILLVASIAALVSYRHLRGLLVADGEEAIVHNMGPLAIDGLMLMSTLALLLTRKVTRDTAPDHDEADAALDRWSAQLATEPAPVSPAPDWYELFAHGDRSTWEVPDPSGDTGTTLHEHTEKTSRAPRTTNADTEAKVRVLLADPELKAESSTLRRYARVARILRDDPAADIDTAKEKVRPELVSIIREHMNRERVR